MITYDKTNITHGYAFEVNSNTNSFMYYLISKEKDTTPLFYYMQNCGVLFFCGKVILLIKHRAARM